MPDHSEHAKPGPGPDTDSRLRLVVLLSGNGSNLQAILDHIERHALEARVVLVISDNPDAAGLQRAHDAGVPAQLLRPGDYPNREARDQALADAVTAARPGLVVLAGFMRILGGAFVERFALRIMNIHPSLLPRYKGLHTHRRVLAAGDAWHGASVHFVTAELDQGPLIIQARIPVRADDDEASLQRRVQRLEHRIYSRAIRWFAEDRLQLRGNEVLLDGRRDPAQGLEASGEPQ